jgi:hypothetical protein
MFDPKVEATRRLASAGRLYRQTIGAADPESQYGLTALNPPTSLADGSPILTDTLEPSGGQVSWREGASKVTRLEPCLFTRPRGLSDGDGYDDDDIDGELYTYRLTRGNIMASDGQAVWLLHPFSNALPGLMKRSADRQAVTPEGAVSR